MPLRKCLRFTRVGRLKPLLEQAEPLREELVCQAPVQGNGGRADESLLGSCHWEEKVRWRDRKTQMAEGEPTGGRAEEQSLHS